MPTLTVDGIPLHYRDEGSGLPVLLFHASPLNGDAYEKQWKALSGRYRFIIPDIRGFGRSGPGEGPTEMTRIAQDGLALLDALGVESAVVGGVSMGGDASVALLREDPGRVRGLVLVATQATADSKDILARYAGPTLVVVGEKDPVTPLEKAKQLAELITGARLEVIADAAHLPNQEQPERFNAVLDSFLSGM